MMKLALNVGVRRSFSMVNGSTTKVTDFANSKPLNCMAMVEGLGKIKYPD